MEQDEIREMLRDLVWLNAVIATELIQITENTSSILRKEAPPATCLEEHAALRGVALAMAEKYRPGTALRQHVEKHQ
ncbi:hypothetical protein ABH15_04305 [Methanoculleus taiwanensis]|uniref:Uncharacterized protein n=1 Tax=Methanoculleus taiwanensis TaxID=1550565 RepID=A0A498H4H2_9EURY|nr:hypothetical protein [Methanoculleus taiwanensis]RXE57327.1 hypothetical protein ABH15_04305 [Methanoculleus taiwanensis]